jgi:hypothetical protein
MDHQSEMRRNRIYLLRRVADERRAAARATCEEAKIAHRQLARCYAAEARDMRRRTLTLTPATVA